MLRHGRSLFDRDQLHYDPKHAAGLSQIIVGEIEDPVTQGVVDLRADGIERLDRRDGSLVFSMSGFRPGLIAIPIGNRYAPKCIQGGLQNPIDLRPNGEVLGGTTITNLAAGNIAGFVNFCWPPDRPVTRIRVLGTIVDPGGRPVSLRDFVEERNPRRGPPPHGVLVGGAAMETGKTTFCCGLFRALRKEGTDVTYIKATGTSFFLGDPLRVQTGDPSIPDGWNRELVLDPQVLRVSDFVDACGVPSDMSTDFATFADGMCRFLGGQTGEVCVAELADSLHHRTNLGLLRSPMFRSQFRSLVYVVDPSLDAARNSIYFIRDVLGWSEVGLVFTGALGTAPAHAALRAEIQARLGVRCLDPADSAALLDWVAAERAIVR